MEKPKPVKPAVSGPMAWLLLFLNWLIPGSGFMIVGRWWRGLTHFLLVTITFFLGISLHSSVAWPTWSIRSEEFNLINNFTFIVQMGSGFLALLSRYASSQYGEAGGGGLLSWLAGIQQHPFYELGSYFLIVAGALNYFSLGNFYDRLVRPHQRFLKQEFPQEFTEEKSAE